MALLRLWQAGRYSIYVLVLLLCAFLLNQLDRYLLAVTNPSMSRDVGYGDKGCLNNLSYPDAACNGVNLTTQER